FLVAFFGALNNLVRQIQNRLGAAIVFLQLDDPRAGELFGKIHDVAKIGAAKRVNALRVVTDHSDIVVGGGEQSDDLCLEVIGVLVLIHHNETVDAGKPVAHLFMIG